MPGYYMRAPASAMAPSPAADSDAAVSIAGTGTPHIIGGLAQMQLFLEHVQMTLTH